MAMEIILEKISRKFNYEWIFKDVNLKIETGTHCAILGSNGSGKSTLLQIISGHLHPSSGKLTYRINREEVDPELIFRHIAISAPYIELIEEFTLTEMVEFHHKFRNFVNNQSVNELIRATTLEKNRNKQLKYFSSGMKQRVKLALAILSDIPVVLLDEPSMNLDQKGIGWYRNLVEANSVNRIYVVCSNSQDHEFDFCRQVISIDDYKNFR
jgi:ABC-type multidrug transport system ATPase subunit